MIATDDSGKKIEGQRGLFIDDSIRLDRSNSVENQAKSEKRDEGRSMVRVLLGYHAYQTQNVPVITFLPLNSSEVDLIPRSQRIARDAVSYTKKRTNYFGSCRASIPPGPGHGCWRREDRY